MKIYLPYSFLAFIRLASKELWQCAIPVLIFGMMGCGPGISDFSVDLGNGYVLDKTSAHDVAVWPRRGGSIDRPHIPAKVIEIAWDKYYVLARQQDLKRRSPNNPQDTYQIPDRISSNYWILDAKLDRVYGPLNRSDFEAMRKSLAIPDSMRFRSVDSCRYLVGSNNSSGGK